MGKCGAEFKSTFLTMLPDYVSEDSHPEHMTKTSSELSLPLQGYIAPTVGFHVDKGHCRESVLFHSSRI